MKYLTLVVYLFSYTTGFMNLGFTLVAWLRTRDRVFLRLLGFLAFFTAKLVVFNAEFFLEALWGHAPVRGTMVNLALVSAASAGFNAFLLLYLRGLTHGPWSRTRITALATLAANPLVLPLFTPLVGPLWVYGLETASDTLLLVVLTWHAWAHRSRARGPLFREMLTALVVLNLVYLPLALAKGWLVSWFQYDPGVFQLANGYYFAANLVLVVLLARHLFLGRPAAPAAERRWSEDQRKAFGISEREAEVVDLLGRGLTNKDIAEKLFISPGTVKNHIYNIYQKTGVQTRVELLNLLAETPVRPS